jgi:hypothetical protein
LTLVSRLANYSAAMAIQRRALFALSIAFTASIVAYPDLPPRGAKPGGRAVNASASRRLPRFPLPS